MENNEQQLRIALVGGGPSALFMYKRLVESGQPNLHITLYERKAKLGAGMPYSTEGAGDEHVTNVSDNEIPAIVTSIEEWVETAPAPLRQRFDIHPRNFNEYKVLPRLFFGEYLLAQFDLLLDEARRKGIATEVCAETTVTDVADDVAAGTVTVETDKGESHTFDAVVICTGHCWPRRHEGKVPNYFDSPYPPAKLAVKWNGPVALRGASLTAVDAIRTLARSNGQFVKDGKGKRTFEVAGGAENFHLVLHTRNGFLPALRFHLSDSQLSKDSVLPVEEVHAVKRENGGFMPLDYLFEKNFKDPIHEQNPELYEKVRDLRMEEFVEKMMELRERLDPFVLFKAEYAEAEQSIRRRESVYWKEMLAVLSFAMNYPAKHLPAEDMLRLQKVLMPLVSIVIAFVPQSSADELLALYEAGRLSLVTVGDDSEVVPQESGGALYRYTDEDGKEHADAYGLFVDCIGQPHLSLADFPFQGLVRGGSLSQALLKFSTPEKGEKEMAGGNDKVIQSESGDYYLQVPGIAINDNFQVMDKYGAANPRVYMMAVPYMGGYNPDYSGLDFGEAASARILEGLLAAHTPVTS